jgi:hypothetical protein
MANPVRKNADRVVWPAYGASLIVPCPSVQVVVFTTSLGNFEAEIFVDKMPITAGGIMFIEP